jgi:hypothetical protein
VNNPTVKLLLQGFLLAAVAALLLVAALFATRGADQENFQRNRLLALRDILGDERISLETDIAEPPMLSRFDLSDGSGIFELEVSHSFASLRVLIRLDRDGEYLSHRVVYLDNPISGWDYGNAFAARQLSELRNDREGQSDALHLLSLRELWSREIDGLIRYAQENRR